MVVLCARFEVSYVAILLRQKEREAPEGAVSRISLITWREQNKTSCSMGPSPTGFQID